jgi:hypothetical protein
VAIFAEELELIDGQELDQDEGMNDGYDVALGWKNLDAATGAAVPDGGDPEKPDTLRTIVIFSDDVEDISSNGEEELEEGDYVSIVQDPEVWKLSYKGLDLTSEDRKGLKFEIKTSDKTISASKGPFTSCDDGSDPSFYPASCASGTLEQATCTIFAPYVEVTSGDTGSVFEVDRSDAAGDLSDDEFIVALDASGTDTDGSSEEYVPPAAVCDATSDGDVTDTPDAEDEQGLGEDLALAPGTVFMKISSSGDDYGFQDYVDDGTANDEGIEVRYVDIGDGDDGFEPPDGGVILVEQGDDVDDNTDEQLGDLLDSDALTPCSSGTCGEDPVGPEAPDGIPDFWFAVAEKAGTGSSNEFVDYFAFAVDGSASGTPGDTTFDFDSVSVGFTLTSDDEKILYGHALANDFAAGFYAGPVASGPVQGGFETVEENYVSERGSVFKLIDSNSVEFDTAHKLARAQWFLAPASTSAGDASKTIVTLGEGESTTVSGVTVKVLEITESVGACSAAGGSVSCTADMSGVSAVLMPNNAPSVTVAMPTSVGNLVILDSDAAGMNTLISVGGEKVNSVSADWLSSAPVDWAAEKKVVREVVAGKILVAGAEKEDTLAAAQDFVAQVKKV